MNTGKSSSTQDVSAIEVTEPSDIRTVDKLASDSPGFTEPRYSDERGDAYVYFEVEDMRRGWQLQPGETVANSWSQICMAGFFTVGERVHIGVAYEEASQFYAGEHSPPTPTIEWLGYEVTPFVGDGAA